MTAILDVEPDNNEDYSEVMIEKLVFDNWLDSGYHLLIPEKESLFSDDY